MADFRFVLGTDKVRYIYFIKRCVQLMEMDVLRAYMCHQIGFLQR